MHLHLPQVETSFVHSLPLSQSDFVDDTQIAKAMKLVNQLDFIDQNATLISYYG